MFEGSGLESVQLPQTLKIILHRAFCDCKSLRSVELPKSLKMMECGCFTGSGLESVIMHGVVPQISYDAFFECEKLHTIELGDGVEKLVEEWFPLACVQKIVVAAKLG